MTWKQKEYHNARTYTRGGWKWSTWLALPQPVKSYSWHMQPGRMMTIDTRRGFYQIDWQIGHGYIRSWNRQKHIIYSFKYHVKQLVVGGWFWMGGNLLLHNCVQTLGTCIKAVGVSITIDFFLNFRKLRRRGIGIKVIKRVKMHKDVQFSRQRGNVITSRWYNHKI